MEETSNLTKQRCEPEASERNGVDGPAQVPMPMVKRILVGVGTFTALGLVLWADKLCSYGAVLAAVCAALTVGGLLEFCRMLRLIGVEVSRLLVAAAGTALLLVLWFGWALQSDPACPRWLADPGTAALALLILTVLGMLAARASAGRIEGSAEAAAFAALGLLYVPVPLAFMGALHAQWGLKAVVTAVVVCKSTDVGGYLAGRTIGGPLLAPVVSPRKTVAGAIGALVAAVLASCVLALLHVSAMGLPLAVLYGVLMTLVAITGDLAESVLKRRAGMKDSGRLLPGQGGVLDMIDDVIFAAPFSWLFFLLAAPGLLP